MADYFDNQYNASDPDPSYQYSSTPAQPAVDVTVIDDREHEQWNQANPGSVPMTNQTSAVDNALMRADGQQIDHLTLIDHGQPGQQHMGEPVDMSDPVKRQEHLENLARLHGHFAEDGQIEMGGCNVASGPEGTQYLRDVARTTGVPTTGAHDLQYPSLPGYEGPTTTCFPPNDPADQGNCYTTDPETGESVPVP